ncbi:probable E3 ubiquitin-protein ligase BAH1-like 2 isoform X3 [Cucumis sativus]|uniref:probable E3 ubiquitin-protein ligase BAH1-like 2 isoform X3 n=1 Tax=Cucumis sativus TaxID=3659 RepID=UPI0012F4E8DA|nr:probable E3 ubiquitin-protein ligase BAH1-like 2 isoform X3 [Cucumis sativus]
MKFCKKYEEYLRGQEKKLKLPGFHFKRLKKILKNCSRDFQSRHRHGDGTCSAVAIHTCPDQCSGGFNQRAQKLLELHLASGFRKYLLWFKGKLESDHAVLVQEGKELVNYALMNAIAVRKILKKYDKIHYSKQGQTFKSQAQSKHIEILQSPWLSELIAFHINLKETKHKSKRISSAFEECSLAITDGKPSLTCELFDSVKLDIDLTCSICLEIVFDPVSLTCGHIFCYMCACSAASVTIVDGLKSANAKAKCPLCREARVYEGAVHLEELNILLSQSCPEYWEKRLETERAERVQQAKDHWESMSRAFMGV